MNLRRNCPKEKTVFARKLRKNMTPSEKTLWKYLRCNRLGVKFRRQAIIRGYIVDFYCPSSRLIIEVDGSSHIGKEKYDYDREKVLHELGFSVLRLANKDVFCDLTICLEKIRYLL